jgi:NAD(P)-dependent dehydrogenase (short-subunit alcohol dehydrogenase family)
VLGHSSDTGGAAAVTLAHYALYNYASEKRSALEAWEALLLEIVGDRRRPTRVRKTMPPSVTSRPPRSPLHAVLALPSHNPDVRAQVLRGTDSSAFPTVGLYHASKWALEGFSQSLAGEVAPLGIKVTIVEPAGYATDWSGPSAKRATPIAAYDEVRAIRAAARAAAAPGDPDASGLAILKVVDADEPPLRIFFGSVGLPMARAEYAQRIGTWEKWNDVSIEAQGDWAAKQANA